ncbi:MAG: hypothetical protein R3Y04_09035 [Rikenellaceae bacterium]
MGETGLLNTQINKYHVSQEYYDVQEMYRTLNVEQYDKHAKERLTQTNENLAQYCATHKLLPKVKQYLNAYNQVENAMHRFNYESQRECHIYMDPSIKKEEIPTEFIATALKHVDLNDKTIAGCYNFFFFINRLEYFKFNESYSEIKYLADQVERLHEDKIDKSLIEFTDSLMNGHTMIDDTVRYVKKIQELAQLQEKYSEILKYARIHYLNNGLEKYLGIDKNSFVNDAIITSSAATHFNGAI